MVIRAAVISEVEELVQMCLRFLRTTHYYEVLERDANEESLGGLIMTLFGEGERACMLVAQDRDGAIVGGIGLLASSHPCTGQLYADELVWWVEPAHRGTSIGPHLLKAGEDWARQQGATLIKMIAPIASDIGRYYERQGYHAIETAFYKELR